MSLYFALKTVENNKNKKSVKFQGDMLNFCDFIQVFVFTRNHHLKQSISDSRVFPPENEIVHAFVSCVPVIFASTNRRVIKFCQTLTLSTTAR